MVPRTLLSHYLQLRLVQMRRGLAVENGTREILKHPMDTLHLSCPATRSVATGQFEEASLAPVHPSSLSLQSPPSDSVDELCKAIPDMPLESVTSWTEVCPEETSRIDAGCSLPVP